MRVALFTDTLGDLNGVSRFISDMAEQSRERGDTLHVITSTAKRCPKAQNIHNFKPRFRLKMPYYNELDLAFPPAKEIEELLNFIDPEMIHISTPGPVGILGRKLAKKLAVPMLGTYHTDFPAYIKDNTGSMLLKRLSDRMMRRFYAPFAHVFSRSEVYETIMRNDIGIEKERLSTIPAGTNLERFAPLHVKEDYWSHQGLKSDTIKVLYVGRITVEKNIPFLLNVWQKLKTHHSELNAELILVGEGKLKKEALKLADLGVHYHGAVYTDELSSIYAMSDIFVFPSITDTLGQVVMEAAASGVPVLVSNQGGPKSLLNTKLQNGYILEAHNAQVWIDTLLQLIESEALRKELSNGAQVNMQAFDIKHSYEHFWEMHHRYYY